MPHAPSPISGVLSCQPTLAVWLVYLRKTWLTGTLALLRLGLCAMLTHPFLATAQDLVSERSYFEDPGSLLQLNDVQAADAAGRFKRYTGILNRGYSASAFWIKLNIQPGGSAEPHPLFNTAQSVEQLILRIRPNYLDEIALYDPLDPQPGPRFTGDRHALADAPYRSLNHNFVIPAAPQARVIWLRLKTRSSSLMDVQVRPFSQTIALDRQQDLLYGVFIGSLLMFLAWAVVHWLTYKERVVGVLAINQLLALLFSLSVLGYFRLAFTGLVPPAWIDQTTSVLALCAAATALYFNTLFLSEFKPNALGLRIMQSLLGLLPIGLLLIWRGEVRIAMQVNVLIVMVAPLAFFVLALTGKAWKLSLQQPAPLFSKQGLLWFYGSVLCMVAMFALPLLGLVDSTEVALQSNSLGGFFTGLILIATLHFRSRRIMQMHHDGLLSLNLAKAQIDQEKQQRQTQSQLMAMLTHELKTPLSVIRMALGVSTQPKEVKARTDRAVQDMNALINRCAWADRLDDGDFVLVKTMIDLASELEELKTQTGHPTRVGLNLPPTASYPLLTDAQSLRMILGNLIENALKYSPTDSLVDVQVKTLAQGSQPGVCVSVVNLPGLAGWPDPAQVFEKYYRSPGAHRQTGSGLGLYLAATLARQLGGNLAYVPDDQGVKFEFWLPT